MASKPVHLETQRAKLERKERVILDAARAVFVEHGFDGARVSEIARRASIGEGTIYSYYESKAELMLAVLQQFWDGLTLEAQAVMQATKAEGFFDRLQALAQYHLQTVIENNDFINLTFALRRNNSEVSVSRDHLRHYVAVFDNLFRRGLDRGEIRPDAVLWQARDVFYGTLEYSARSIEMTIEPDRDCRQTGPVVDQMIALFRAHYGAADAVPEPDQLALDAMAKELKNLSAKLDRLAANQPR
ncbi:MAG: TetR/AcrR family transcriptional regulator [Parasphingorhabdus sp.]|uniref:TetR/AcrR family transcriptional regulator n=1 Tax=Parasphingorhabdus sp. TaxID=2709688 RepID=UPI00329A69F1